MAVLVANQAEGTLSVASNTSPYEDRLFLQTGEGLLFPNPSVGIFDFFYVRVGDDAQNNVVKVIANSSDTFTLSEDFTVTYPIDTPVKLTVSSELLNHYKTNGVISDTTIHIAGSTPTFDNLYYFKENFGNTAVKEDKILTVNIHGGIYSGLLTEVLSDADYQNAERIAIVGDTKNITISSIQSSSGSAGNYSIILNVDSVAELEESHVVFITAGAVSSGTNPDYLYGAHEITNVDGGNTRITILSKHQAATAPSGSVAGAVPVFKTVLQGLSLSKKGFYSITNVAFRGDTSGDGIACSAGVTTALNSVAVLRVDNGINIQSNAFVSSSSNLIISGCSISGIVNSGGRFNIGGTLITGCALAIQQTQGSFASSSLKFYGCADGVNISTGSSGTISTVTAKDTTGTAFEASRYAYLQVTSPTLTSNGTNYDPSLNTQGNKYGYIDDGT